MRKKVVKIVIVSVSALLASCSSTSNLPEGEVLYTGLKEITYLDDSAYANAEAAKIEVEAALACAPNGSLFGSSSLRSPFQFKLWIYNTFANSESGFGRWMRNTFGSEPVLMSNVNPEVRALVAQNVLNAYGFFNAKVAARDVPSKNPKKAKIAYDVRFNQLYTIDTLRYVGFPSSMDSLVAVADSSRAIHGGDGFSLSALDAERTRLYNLFRSNGFYYYRSDYATFLADSVSTPDKVEVHLQPVADMPDNAKRKWYLGKLRVEMRKQIGEQLTDSIDHRFLSVHFNGKKPPIRLGAILRDITLRPRQLYDQNKYSESLSSINSMGLFSLTNFSFTPRDTTAACDTLDMTLTCVFDKPYDGTLEANYSIKSNDRTGPGLVLGLTKRNAFRGGEKLTFNIKGSYEWQTGKRVSGNSSTINSYEYGADLSIEYPRLETPFKLFRRHRFYKSPSTVFSLSYDVLNRAKYFKMTTLTAAATYKFRTSANSTHEFSPLLIDYTHFNSMTTEFFEMWVSNPSLLTSMTDQFIPKIKYTYTYSSPSSYANPIVWETSVTEAGNVLSLGYMAAGKKFNEKGKELFGNPFAQFLKLTTSLRKTWTLTPKSQLVGRIAGGILWSYGNSTTGPYSEQFYVGGANSIRAFTIRSIGPGRYVADSQENSYIDQVGDMKFEANLEYRFNIFGSLYGAAFLDAGNIWTMTSDDYRSGSNFSTKNLLKQIATGTGVGIRYDLDFFVLRFDVGIGIHVPYDTGKSGYYNIPKFTDGLGYHLAIGYPF